jgi:hypothetical protein
LQNCKAHANLSIEKQSLTIGCKLNIESIQKRQLKPEPII